MILIKKKKKNDFENIFKHLVFILRIKRRSSTKHYNNNNNNNNNRNKLKTNFHKVKLPNFKLIIRFKKKKGGGGGGGIRNIKPNSINQLLYHVRRRGEFLELNTLVYHIECMFFFHLSIKKKKK